MVHSSALPPASNHMLSFAHPTPTPTKFTFPIMDSEDDGLLTSDDVSLETKKRDPSSIYNEPWDDTKADVISETN